MPSTRFPINEIQDALRSLFCPNQAEWDRLIEENPGWQLKKRRRSKLTLAMAGEEGRFRPVPFPEKRDDNEEKPLIVPRLFDTPYEGALYATMKNEPITAVIVEYRSAESLGIVENLARDDKRFQQAVYEIQLWVLNQDAAYSKMTRYLNWFSSTANRLNPSAFVTPSPTGTELDKYIALCGTGGPVDVGFEVVGMERERIAVKALIVEAALTMVDQDDDILDTD